MKVDPVSVEVIRGAFTFTAEEMGVALRRSAYSPNIKERLDYSCAIFDPKKRLIAQAEHIPVHLGSMSFGVKSGLRHLKGAVKEGEMILFNDPYLSGTHLPDLTLIAPAYHGGSLIAYVVNKAHHADIGGRAPGSLAGDATELFQEGIIIPPMRLVREGRLDEDLVDLILSNVRTPEERAGDLRAQIAANNLGANKVLKLVDDYGVEAVQGAVEAMMDQSQKRMVSKIGEMPEGVYQAEDCLEDTGVEEKTVTIRVKVIVNRGSIVFDYTGTDHQVEAPINAPLGVTISGVYYTLLCITDPTIPVNEGCFRPAEVIVPAGCILNPEKPAPVSGGNVETSQRNVDVLFRAFSKIAPDRVCAAGQGTMNNICVGGKDPQTGSPWTFYETVGGGYGGRLGMDGVDGIQVHMTNTLNTPIEAIEASYPLRFQGYGLIRDSGGPGKWRGGCGIERSWTLLAPSATLSILGERTKLQPWGLFGGNVGARGEYLIKKHDGETLKLRSKCVVGIKGGDTLLVRTPGGGGYGNPLERDPDMVLKDVVNDLVSVEAARDEYGVVIDRDEMVVNARATEELRNRMLNRENQK